jgi:hypothetical protein
MRTLKLKQNSRLKGKFRITTYEAGTENIVHQGDWQENLITNANMHGHNIIVRHLFGDITYPLEITRARFGTSNTAPTDTDTDIVDPLAYNIEIATREYIDTTGIRVFFFAPNVFIPDDTYYTFATYAGTQTFGMHLLDIPFVKSGAVDTTIEYEYFINNETGS